jgi:hypothetical protein
MPRANYTPYLDTLSTAWARVCSAIRSAVARAHCEPGEHVSRGTAESWKAKPEASSLRCGTRGSVSLD